MPYDDYFSGAERAASSESRMASHANAFLEYQRETAVRELVDVPRDSLSPAAGARLDATFNEPTTVHCDASMKEERWPVVLYQSGARSSYDGSVLLAELLASRGYLVMWSAFPREDNTDFRPSMQDDSRTGDHRRLLLELHCLPSTAFPWAR